MILHRYLLESGLRTRAVRNLDFAGWLSFYRKGPASGTSHRDRREIPTPCSFRWRAPRKWKARWSDALGRNSGRPRAPGCLGPAFRTWSRSHRKHIQKWAWLSGSNQRFNFNSSARRAFKARPSAQLVHAPGWPALRKVFQRGFHRDAASSQCRAACRRTNPG